ncbi:MAG TPA: hypothetical protein PKG48_14310 [Bacteroidales bacterium]|nr:hypothetical protein [Bacteroidales bacterium]
MKKFLILITMLFAFAAICAVPAQSQTVTKQIAFGAKAVDSLYGAVTTYYYVNSASPTTGKTAAASRLNEYYVYAIMAGTTRSAAPTGTDSCQITFEVSMDNSTWYKFTGTTPKVTGGAVYKTSVDMVTTTTDGTCAFAPTACYYPYVRVKFQHYKASCTMYPTAHVVLKKY